MRHQSGDITTHCREYFLWTWQCWRILTSLRIYMLDMLVCARMYLCISIRVYLHLWTHVCYLMLWIYGPKNVCVCVHFSHWSVFWIAMRRCEFFSSDVEQTNFQHCSAPTAFVWIWIAYMCIHFMKACKFGSAKERCDAHNHRYAVIQTWIHACSCVFCNAFHDCRHPTHHRNIESFIRGDHARCFSSLPRGTKAISGGKSYRGFTKFA